jgi:YggT family protein
MSLIEAIYVYFLHPLLTILVWVIIINAILSWLVAFRVVNPHNQLVSMIGRFTMGVTDPLLRPIRRFVPPLGGIDITPIILILAIFFTRDWVLPQLLRFISGSLSGL